MRNKRLEGNRAARALAFTLGLILAAVVQVRAQNKQVQEFHQTYSLSPYGHFSLDNVNGSVHIAGWDQNQVKVDAVKSVWSGTSLSDVTIEVDSRPDSIHIESKCPHRWFGDSHWRVDYTITVPSHVSIDKVGVVNGGVDIDDISGHVSASSVNGRIQTRDTSGGTDLSAVNGTIGTVLTTPDLSQPVSIKTVNGSISLSVPSDINAHLSAGTLNGGIACEFPIKINPGYVGHSLDGTVGKGGSEIRLKTVNGSISISRTASEAN
jgi:hypothetical protein